MTTERMTEIAAELVADLQPNQAGQFAYILKTALENSYTTEQLEVIDLELLAAGVDVNPICRKKHPTT